MAKVLKIDHVALIVDDIESSMVFWQEALGIELSHIDDIPSEQSKVAFFPLASSEIELVQPTTSDSGLARYLEKRGPGMHHPINHGRIVSQSSAVSTIAGIHTV